MLQRLRRSVRSWFKPPEAPLPYYVDRYSFFQGSLHFKGWLGVPADAVAGLALRLPDGSVHPIIGWPLPISDETEIEQDAAPPGFCFEERLHVSEFLADIVGAQLLVTFIDGEQSTLANLGRPLDDPAHHVFTRFQEMLRERKPGRILEVGSRARSGIVRRGIVPWGWKYSGLDVLRGPNVDVVGDAHRVSQLYPAGHFDAVMAHAVLEHMMMPWKFVIELNRVLKPDAVGIFVTTQCWPLHDQPWDFWRFSDSAWPALLNRGTGFEILEAGMGEPAYIVAAKCHAVTAFAETPAGALGSSVLFRKIGETRLQWPVELEDLTATTYPTATITDPTRG